MDVGTSNNPDFQRGILKGLSKCLLAGKTMQAACEVKNMDATEKTIDDYLYKAKDGEQYGIFKLSPRECLRLMDVKDRDIDQMLSVNSNSQCYKQAGNSIVVNVLVAIFGQLFEGKEDFYKHGSARENGGLINGN